MSIETVPNDLHCLRACLSCSLIKTFGQFQYEGCENCEFFLEMKDNPDNVYACTSSNFDGMIAAMNPKQSWVCKWQKIDSLCKGVYAISVSGTLPRDIIKEMRRKGIFYRPRDTSQK